MDPRPYTSHYSGFEHTVSYIPTESLPLLEYSFPDSSMKTDDVVPVISSSYNCETETKF